MKYGHSISSAFATLKSGTLWGFAVSTYGAMMAVYAVLMGGAVAILGPSHLIALIRNPGFDAGDWIAPAVTLSGAALVALLVGIPLSLIMHGGFVHLTDEVLAKRPVSVGQGWAFGAKRMGRTFAIDFLIGLVVFGILFVAMIPVAISFVGVIAAGSDSSSGGAFVGVCCGYLLFLMLAIALSLLASGFEAIAIRYGLVGTRTTGAALGAGWQAFKARWKNVVVFALIVMGLGYAYNLVTSIVTAPLQFFVIPNTFTAGDAAPSPELISRFAVGYVVLLAVSFLIAMPFSVFQYSLWSAFFRQLTGLDVVVAPTLTPPTPPMSAEAPAAPAYAPPAPPAAPAAPAPAEPTPPAPGSDG